MAMPLKQLLKNSNGDEQKHPFAVVIQNKCSLKVSKSHMKKPVYFLK